MKDLTSGHEGKSILLFTLPMLIGAVFQQLYNTADAMIVGRYIGKDAMAAVSGANPIMFLLTSFLMGITLGFSLLVSQYYGSKKMYRYYIYFCFYCINHNYNTRNTIEWSYS